MKARDFIAGLDMIRWTKERLRAECLVAYNQTCGYCGRKGGESFGPDGRVWHLDRQLPGVLGGKYEPCNVVLSCAECNFEKGGKDPADDPKWESQMCLGQIMFHDQVFTYLVSTT